MIFPEISNLAPAPPAETKEKSADDLISLLAEETKSNQNGAAPQGPAPNPNDFEEPPAPEIKQPETQEPEIIEEPANFADEAMMLIGFVDALQTLILPIAYQNAVFTSQERDKLRHWKKTGQPAPGNQTEKDRELIARVSDYKELTEDIDFTPGEINMLHDPLKRVMEKYNWRMTAEMALFGAVLAVMGPRLMPLTNRFEKLM